MYIDVITVQYRSQREFSTNRFAQYWQMGNQYFFYKQFKKHEEIERSLSSRTAFQQNYDLGGSVIIQYTQGISLTPAKENKLVIIQV